MARLGLAILVLLLSGCNAPSTYDPSLPAQDDARRSISGVPPPLEFAFQGSLTGVGVIEPDGTATFYGQSPFSHDFEVPSGAASVDLTLTWNVTAPALLQLRAFGPSGEFVTVDARPETLAQTLTLAIPTPGQGTWEVSVRSQGPALVEYVLRGVITLAEPSA